VEGKRIASVRTLRRRRATSLGHLVDLGEHILLPGLINTHFPSRLYDAARKIAPTVLSPTGSDDHTREGPAHEQDYIDSINAGFAEAQRFGTTTIAQLTAFPSYSDLEVR